MRERVQATAGPSFLLGAFALAAFWASILAARNIALLLGRGVMVGAAKLLGRGLRFTGAAAGSGAASFFLAPFTAFVVSGSWTFPFARTVGLGVADGGRMAIVEAGRDIDGRETGPRTED